MGLTWERVLGDDALTVVDRARTDDDDDGDDDEAGVAMMEKGKAGEGVRRWL